MAEEEIRKNGNLSAADDVAIHQGGSSNSFVVSSDKSSSSLMLNFGRYGTLLPVCLGILALVFDFPIFEEIGFVIALGSFLSFTIFMWMLGAIEQRLIEINQSLKSKK